MTPKGPQSNREQRPNQTGRRQTVHRATSPRPDTPNSSDLTIHAGFPLADLLRVSAAAYTITERSPIDALR